MSFILYGKMILQNDALRLQQHRINMGLALKRVNALKKVMTVPGREFRPTHGCQDRLIKIVRVDGKRNSKVEKSAVLAGR